MRDQFKKKDEELFRQVEKLLKGDFTSYKEVYSLSEKYIYKIIFDIVKDPYATEDIMQDTYLQIYNKINMLSSSRAFYVWAGRIATNYTLRYIEKNRKEVLIGVGDEDEDGQEFLFERVTDDNETFIPESVLIDKEKCRLIAEIIDGLSIEQKLCVQYFYYEEMPVNEISERMGVSTGTVKSRLNYARKSIKRAVIELNDKHDTRLYSFATVPFLYIIFRQGAEEFVIPKVATGAVSAGIIGTAASAAEVSSAQAGGAKAAGIAGEPAWSAKSAEVEAAKKLAAKGQLGVRQASGSISQEAIVGGGSNEAVINAGVKVAEANPVSKQVALGAIRQGVANSSAKAVAAGTVVKAATAPVAAKVVIAVVCAGVVFGGGAYSINKADAISQKANNGLVATSTQGYYSQATLTEEEVTEIYSNAKQEYSEAIEIYESNGYSEEQIAEFISNEGIDTSRILDALNRIAAAWERAKELNMSYLTASQFDQIIGDMEDMVNQTFEMALDISASSKQLGVSQRDINEAGNTLCEMAEKLEGLLSEANTFLTSSITRDVFNSISSAQVNSYISSGNNLPMLIIQYVNDNNDAVGQMLTNKGYSQSQLDDWVNQTNVYAGVSTDYINYISKMTGTK